MKLGGFGCSKIENIIRHCEGEAQSNLLATPAPRACAV
jgi:hypothetical protein